MKTGSLSVAQSDTSRRQNLVTVISVLILVGTEVFGLALAGGWAIAGLFELGETFGYVLMGLFSLLGAYAMLALWRNAVTVEPIR